MGKIFDDLKNFFNLRESIEENLFPIDADETVVDISDDAFIMASAVGANAYHNK